MADEVRKSKIHEDDKCWQSRIIKEEECARMFAKRNIMKEIMEAPSDCENAEKEGKPKRKKKPTVKTLSEEVQMKAESPKLDETTDFFKEIIPYRMPCTEGPKIIALPGIQPNRNYCKPLPRCPPMYKPMNPQDDTMLITLGGSCRIKNPNAGLPKMRLCSRPVNYRRLEYATINGVSMVLSPNPKTNVFGPY